MPHVRSFFCRDYKWWNCSIGVSNMTLSWSMKYYFIPVCHDLMMMINGEQLWQFTLNAFDTKFWGREGSPPALSMSFNSSLLNQIFLCAFGNPHPKRRRNSSHSDDAFGRRLKASWRVVAATVAVTEGNRRWLLLGVLPRLAAMLSSGLACAFSLRSGALILSVFRFSFSNQEQKRNKLWVWVYTGQKTGETHGHRRPYVASVPPSPFRTP